ncbi:MAG: tetratricopeptide repeat protein [Candidatus Thorarchaeota archaeon]
MYICNNKGELDPALDYAKKSLALNKEMNYPTGIEAGLSVIGWIHFNKGDIDQAMQFFDQALGIKGIGNIDKFNATSIMSRIYGIKGELDLALKYHKQALTISEAMGYKYPDVTSNWVNIGNIYRMKGDYNKAIEFLKRNLYFNGEVYLPNISVFLIVLINLDKGLREEAQQYLSRLKDLTDKTENERIYQLYQVTRAIVLKAGVLARNRAEAESLLKQVVKGEVIDPEMYILSLVSLCEFLLEELENSNEPKILDEINPVITRLLDIAEK